MSLKIAMHLEGAQHVKDTFRSLPRNVHVRIAEAIRQTAQAVERGAKMRVPVSSGGRESRKAKWRPGPGELRDTIRAEIVEGEGYIAGYVKAGMGKLRRRLKGKPTKKRTMKVRAKRLAAGTQKELGVYAMVVEYGSPRQGKPAKPYLRPALEAEKPRHVTRMQVALQRAADDSIRGGGSAA